MFTVLAEKKKNSKVMIKSLILQLELVTSGNRRITVCAVAQHCYNGDISFLWEKWKL